MKRQASTAISIIALLLFFLAITVQHVGSSEPEIEWTRTYGGGAHDVGDEVVQTTDGGFALAGYTESSGAGSQDFWLVKTDTDGTMEWNKTYGGAHSDEARYVTKTTDGGYALAGNTQSFGTGGSDFWLVKTDSHGHPQWNKTYGGNMNDDCHFVMQTADGGYAMTGETWSFGAGSNDFWFVKVNQTGEVEWQRAYGGTSEDHAYSLVETTGGYVLVGCTKSFGAGNFDIWLVKTDMSGNVLWNQTYGGLHDDRCYSLAKTQGEDYILAGFTSSSGVGGRDFWLIKTDSSGNIVWENTYGGVSNDWALSLTRISDNGFLLAGVTTSFGAGSYDCWLVKTDEDGNMQWNVTAGGPSDDRAFSVIQTSSGFAVAGMTQSSGAGRGDMWLIKLTPEIDWEYIFKDPCSGTELRISIDDNHFQFITSDSEFPIKHDAGMRVHEGCYYTSITICYEDDELRLFAFAVDGSYDFCVAYAVDKTTGQVYFLRDTLDTRGWCGRGDKPFVV